jgi:hypothetical protein
MGAIIAIEVDDVEKAAFYQMSSISRSSMRARRAFQTQRASIPRDLQSRE